MSRDLAALRDGLEELKKSQLPRPDSEQVMDDLSREIRRLRDRLAQPLFPSPPGASIPTLPPLRAEFLSGGVGGSQQGINDLYWVLSRVAVGGEERIVLALYQASPAGRGFKLTGVRFLSADLQVIELGQDKPRVREILDELKKAQK
jgi:hypothetical protein